MAATAKEKTKQGILTNPTTSYHEVRYTPANGLFAGQTRYGTVRAFYEKTQVKSDKPIIDAAERGNLLVDDMILPVCIEVPEALCVKVDWDDAGMKAFEKAANKEALALAAKAGKGVQVGKMFSLPVADGAAHYVVTAVKGTKCDVEWRGWNNGDRYVDHYFGWGRKNVPVATVRKYVSRAEGMAELFKQKEPNFIEAQADGTIVHYCNGFGQFVRCEVVNQPPTDWHGDEDEKPTKSLKPIALVGKWSKHDLPHYGIDGHISEGTYVGYIREGKLIYVNPSNLYESPDHSKRNDEGDPRKMKPIDLTLPPPTPEQAAQFAAWQAIGAVHAAMADQYAETEEQMKARKGAFRKKVELNYDDPKAMTAEAKRRLFGAYKVLKDFIATLPSEKRSENPLDRYRFVDEKPDHH